MNLQAFTNDVRSQTVQLASFGHTLKFDLEDMGVIWINARENPPVVSNDDLEADCTLYFSERAIEEEMIAQNRGERPKADQLFGKLYPLNEHDGG